MKRKLALNSKVASLADVASETALKGFSGSDLEAVLVRSILEAEAADSSEVTVEHLRRAFADFIPTTNNLERELQILAAILECTSRELLPERFRDIDRGAVQLRLSEIKLELKSI